ncbi:hypothetical protein BCA37_31065 (plasmid) [Mycobacterium sp. djl-10]|nr:hypothetical protein BCA37_31065 [Mycobacterium sp. djl-10]
MLLCKVFRLHTACFQGCLMMMLFLLFAAHSPCRGVSMECWEEVAAILAAPSGSEARARGELLP